MNKKTVFLTGATGTMGKAGLKELLHRTDRFNITLLVRPSKRNQKSMAQYEKNPNIRIVWGDLNNYDDILAAVTGADIVLHVGGLVSPKADYVPKQTLRVNIGAVENIVKAIKAQPDPDNIKLVYIGSVAQTGHRNPPIHWGRTGDPISASIHDYYGLSKTVAERIVAESGLKHWVSLRQSGILSTEMLFNGSDPISFHVPIAGVLEWATTEDSGRLLANVCEDNVPEEFWNRFYNISSGASYRLTNYEFEAKVMKALSCPAPEKIFGANWFATENFHGQWYTDADVLENYLHFRANIPSDEYFHQLAASLPWYFRLAKIVPACLIKAVMHTVASKEIRNTRLDKEQERRNGKSLLRFVRSMGRNTRLGQTKPETPFGNAPIARPRIRRNQTATIVGYRRHAESRRIQRREMPVGNYDRRRYYHPARMGMPVRTPVQSITPPHPVRRALVPRMRTGTLELRKNSPRKSVLCPNMGTVPREKRQPRISRRTERQTLNRPI